MYGVNLQIFLGCSILCFCRINYDEYLSLFISFFFPERKTLNKNIVKIDFFFISPSQDGSAAAAAATKSLQSCPTLCDPIDGSPRGSPIPGILQARTPE